MNAGNRNNLFRLIEAVERAETFAELRDALVPVLNTLAIYAIQSEAGVIEDNEAWREDYARKLRNETRESAAAQAQQGAEARHQAARGSSIPAPGEPEKRRQPEDGRRGHRSGGTRRPGATARPEPGAQRGPAVSGRLMAIMNGTHPSLDSDGE